MEREARWLVWTAAASPVLASVWAAGMWGRAPGSWFDAAAGGAVLAAALGEALLARWAWVGEVGAAHPGRFAFAAAVAIAGLAMCWRVQAWWPLGAPEFSSEWFLWATASVGRSREGFAIYGLCAAGGACAAWYGVSMAARQAWGMAFVAAGGARRRRARSDLHGDARFMRTDELGRLGEAGAAGNIILGQAGAGARARLVTYKLEGSAQSYAPPRVGKTALIILNLLDPGRIGWRGSTVIVDPRGNIYATTARARRSLGRKVVLVDPFGVVEGHRERFGKAVNLAGARSATYNPCDLIRHDMNHSSDIEDLVRVLLTSPKGEGGNSQHFYGLVLNIVTGLLSWGARRDPEGGSLAKALTRAQFRGKELAQLAASVRADPEAGPWALRAVDTLERLGTSEEGNSAFTSLLNQFGFVSNEFIGANLERSSFDPMGLAEGNMDIYIVCPQERFTIAAPWLRMWMAIPARVAARAGSRHRILVYLDEMASIGYLDPVVESFTMAAGNGLHYWCFAQTPSALDETWGSETRAKLTENAEVLQVLGFPRYGPEMAREMAEVIGSATFHNRTETRPGDGKGGGGGRLTVAEALVSEKLIGADKLARLPPDMQVVLSNTRRAERHAAMFRHARYWERDDCFFLWDDDPLELAKIPG